MVVSRRRPLTTNPVWTDLVGKCNVCVALRRWVTSVGAKRSTPLINVLTATRAPATAPIGSADKTVTAAWQWRRWTSRPTWQLNRQYPHDPRRGRFPYLQTSVYRWNPLHDPERDKFWHHAMTCMHMWRFMNYKRQNMFQHIYRHQNEKTCWQDM